MNFERYIALITEEQYRLALELADKRASLKSSYKDQRYTKLSPTQTEFQHIIGEMAVANFLELEYTVYNRRTRSAYRSDFVTSDKRPVGLWIKTSGRPVDPSTREVGPFFRQGMRYPLNKIPFVFVHVQNPFRPVIIGWAFTTDMLELINKKSRTVKPSDLRSPSSLKPVIEKVVSRTEPKSKPFEIKYGYLDRMLRQIT